jgi:hypothetical protein
LFLWSARQILSDPINFYGFSVNWYGHEMPAYLVIKNPPLVSYCFAAIAYLFGWHELAFHCSVLLLAIAVIVGAYRLAGCFCSSPLLAASVSVFTPLFLVSSTTVMCDVMMLSLWVWAIVFWIQGIRRNEGWLLYLASFVIVLCTLTKYIGVSLIPLLFIFSLAHKRKFGVWLLPLLMCALALWWYEYATRELYGFGLLSDAFHYSKEVKNLKTKDHISNVVIGLSFLGGCLINVTILLPILCKKRTIITWLIGVSLLTFILPLLGTLNNYQLVDANGVKWSLAVHLSLFLAAGVGFLALCTMDFLDNRDEYGLILSAWIIGIFTFATFLNWTINARSFLPLAPAAGILMVRRLERLTKASKMMPAASIESVQGGDAGENEEDVASNRTSCKTTRIRGSIPRHERKFNTLQLQKSVRPEVSKGEKDFCKRLNSYLYSSLCKLGVVCGDLRIVLLLAVMVLLAFLVTWADYRLANTARDAAIRIGTQYVKDGRTLWFQGHWGFQYYMEKEGAKPLDMKSPIAAPGDILVIPSNNTNVYAVNKYQMSLIDTIKLIPASWITTMSPVLGAGFYWDAKGPVPFATGCVPPEEYYVLQLQNLMNP